MTTALLTTLRTTLLTVAESAHAPAMRAYMRDQFDFLGVRTPQRRASCSRSAAEGNLREIINIYISLCGVFAADQSTGEHGDSGWIGMGRTSLDLAGDHVACGTDMRSQVRRRAYARCLRMQPNQLEVFHLQPQSQRIPPADIRASVGVVSDPGRQDHRTGRQIGPAIGPRGASHRDQRGVETIDGIAAVRNSENGLIELGAGAGKDMIAAETNYKTAKADYDFQSNIGLNKEIQTAKAEVDYLLSRVARVDRRANLQPQSSAAG